jgi:hypothetical protein
MMKPIDASEPQVTGRLRPAGTEPAAGRGQRYFRIQCQPDACTGQSGAGRLGSAGGGAARRAIGIFPPVGFCVAKEFFPGIGRRYCSGVSKVAWQGGRFSAFGSLPYLPDIRTFSDISDIVRFLSGGSKGRTYRTNGQDILLSLRECPALRECPVCPCPA